jgi:hypothetical protein
MAPQRSLKTPVAPKKSEQFLGFMHENATIRQTTKHGFWRRERTYAI